ncbi:MAG: CaiB/BaiF CoA-transferase family protein [Acidaminococcaceae bacterium]|nr:CaiB/BaiF CoA-transferase family protein [Acidaminococcaceae bacterium]
MGALTGIRVLDLTRLLPGPYCSMMLADFGAEVIKIEEPLQGDYARSFTPMQNGFGYWHLQLNRNKKSLAVNLKTEEGREIFFKLLAKSDVVMESYRPGVLARLGIDYAEARKVNPKIVYCSLNGYGSKGPRVNEADHDINYVSLAGIVSMSGDKDGKPAIPGVLMADMNAASLAAFSILAALRHAQVTGEGQEIEIALYNTALTLMPGAASLYFGEGFVAERGNNWLTGANANYNIYETKDGRYMAVGALEKKFWSNLCAALGRSELTDLTDDDGSHEMLRKELALEFSKKTLKEWTDLLAGKDTCTTPVLDFAEAMAAEQTLANEMVLEAEDEEVGKYRQIGFPMKLSVTPAELFRRAPRLGEHNQEILRECGFDDASEERGKR